jgi:hypothetical protein
MQCGPKASARKTSTAVVAFALKGIFIGYGAQQNFTYVPIGGQEVSREPSEARVAHTPEVFEAIT